MLRPPRLPLTLIAAVSRNGVIGRAGRVPWDLPEDRAHFRNTTMGHAIIMGRRTWDETSAPLPGRRNLVVSRGAVANTPGRENFATLEQAICAARATDCAPMVIGGAEIFALAMPLATRLVLSELQFATDGDTFFPGFDRHQWQAVSEHPGDRATYVTYERT